MAIEKRLDVVNRRKAAAIPASASIAATVATRRGVVETRVYHLLRVGVVASKAGHGPPHRHRPGEAPLRQSVAHPHDVVVVAATAEYDARLVELRCDERVEVSLYALRLPVLLALLGVGHGGRRYLLHSERHRLVHRADKHSGVVGETAQARQVLALHVGLHAQQPLVVGVAGMESLLIVCAHRFHVSLAHGFCSFGTKVSFAHGSHGLCFFGTGVIGCVVKARAIREIRGIRVRLKTLIRVRRVILEYHAQSVAADGGVAHHGVRVGYDLRLQRLQTTVANGFFTLHPPFFTLAAQNMVEVHQRESCQRGGVLLALAALEAAGHGE